MILRRLECRSANLVTLGIVSLLFLLIWGQVLSPPIGGSASVNVMSGVLCPSTTSRAAISASSLCAAPVCDLTLPMCVLYSMSALEWMMLSASCRRCVWGWWVKLRGSMEYIRMVLMLKALSVSIERDFSCLLVSSARVIAASSARFIVCLSDSDFIYICVLVLVFGFTMDAPRVGLPVTRDPSV